MTNSDVKMAFAHPKMRAISPDRISVRDYIVPIEIGAFQAERGITQRVSFNIVVEVAAPDADLGDDVDKILSYDRVTEAVNDVLAACRFNLLETLAQQIADQILTHHVAQRVFVRIEKLDRGQATLGVEIERVRQENRSIAGAPMPQPVVIYLSPEAVQSDDLRGYLQYLGRQSSPVILCLKKEEAAAHLQDTYAQLRIDLLTIEQQAWKLTTFAPQCKVVDTRTELDWGMRNGQISIWAPSKLVFDSPYVPHDLAKIIPWFAKMMQAKQIIAVGQGAAPPFADVHYSDFAGAML